MQVLRLLLLLSGFLIAVAVNGQEVRAVKITELETIISESKHPLIINMWATWCKPCVEEIPYFQQQVTWHKGDSVQLLLVSLDFKENYPEGIRSFIKKRNITANVVWLNETNADYFCPKIDSTWSGAIPATLFINRKTGYRKFAGDQLSEEELKKEIMALLQKK